jgi:hypothetical protein
MKTQTIFKDLQGRTLRVGDRVAFASYKNLGMAVGTIIKLGKLNVHVHTDNTHPLVNIHWLPEGWTETFRPNELVKVAV